MATCSGNHDRALSHSYLVPEIRQGQPFIKGQAFGLSRGAFFSFADDYYSDRGEIQRLILVPHGATRDFVDG